MQGKAQACDCCTAFSRKNNQTAEMHMVLSIHLKPLWHKAECGCKQGGVAKQAQLALKSPDGTAAGFHAEVLWTGAHGQ